MVSVPGIATAPTAEILIAVVPAPVPVFMSSVPVPSEEIAAPLVAFPAVIVVAI
jgi:hypothetical protein